MGSEWAWLDKLSTEKFAFVIDEAAINQGIGIGVP